MTKTENNYSKGIEAIQKMQEETKTGGKTTRDFVLENKKEILELKKKGFTYIEIAERLQKADVNISAQTLGRILRAQPRKNKPIKKAKQTTTRHITTDNDAAIFEKA